VLKGSTNGKQINGEMVNTLRYKGTTNQNNIEIPSHLSEWLSSEKQKNIGEHARVVETLYSVGKNINYCSHMAINRRLLKTLKMEPTYDMLYHSWRYIRRNIR
jgi:hypothetical protein